MADKKHSERLKTLFKDWRSIITKNPRQQYRTDAIALLCQGLEKQDENTLKYGIWLEQGAYYTSRTYVPFGLVQLFRRGIFEESFTFVEVKHVCRILVVMHLIDLAGHFSFRYMTQPVVDKLTKVDSQGQQKQLLEDYMTQKSYFTSTKNNKL